MKKMIALLLLIAGSLGAMPKGSTPRIFKDEPFPKCSIFFNLKFFHIQTEIYNANDRRQHYCKDKDGVFLVKEGQPRIEISPEEFYAAYEVCMKAAAIRK